MVTLERLRQRRDFLNLNSQGRKFVTQSLIMLTTPSPAASDASCRLGFTATRKLGGAVVRNSIRRRLKEAARLTFPAHARAGQDYVLIARPAALERPFPALQQDMRFALSRLHRETEASA
jgi:ribonuclease P protein component